MAVFEKPRFSSEKSRKVDIPEGLCEKCSQCGELNFATELERNLEVCPKCGFHNRMSAWERISTLVDDGSFEETDAGLASKDVLNFTGVVSYSEKLEENRRNTHLRDAVITGMGRIGGHPVSLAVMDFSFLGASMGSVVGEKITRAIERATARRCALVIVSASGGARMYEGMFSLMQMAKTSGALARHAQEKLLYISLLTNPTTAGVMASFASLGDIIMAEPGAMIGFAGPRVIRETTRQDLPKGFQTAEFLLERGLIDMIVSREKLRGVISRLIGFFAHRPVG